MMEGIIDEWDGDIQCYMVDKAIVFKDGTIKFIFKNGWLILKVKSVSKKMRAK